MKTKGNGGYQIIDFEGQTPNTLDVAFFDNTIARGKPLWVNNLVVNGETYSGVASVKKTLTHIILVIATIQLLIALEDGATTYEESGDNYTHDLALTPSDFDSGSFNLDEYILEAREQNKMFKSTITIKKGTYVDGNGTDVVLSNDVVNTIIFNYSTMTLYENNKDKITIKTTTTNDNVVVGYIEIEEQL